MQPFCPAVQEASCLNYLVTVNDPCAPADMQAGQLDVTALYPDFAWQTIDAISDRGNAVAELKALRWIAIQRVTDDLMAVIRKNNMTANVGIGHYVTTGTADCTCNAAALTGTGNWRGTKVELKRCQLSHSLKRIHVSNLYLYSKVDYVSVDILVKDNGYQYTLTIPDVKAGKNDIYQMLNMLPVVSEGKGIEFLIDINQYPDLCTVKQFCPCSLKGGKLPFNLYTFNGLGYETGSKLKSAGIVAEVGTVCNYSNLLCLFAGNGNKTAAWLILYKMGELIAEKTLFSHRFNPFVLFGKEEAEEKRAKYNALYSEKYRDIVIGLKDTLTHIDQDCLTCRGTKILTNI